MTPEELIPIIRTEYLDEYLDTAATEAQQEAASRYKTSAILREIQTGQKRACWRGDLKWIYDNSTSEICDIELEGGQVSYKLDPRILRIASVVLDTSYPPLIHTTLAKLNEKYPYWRNDSGGRPRYFYVMSRKLYLYPKPSSTYDGDTLSLSVWREPLYDLDSNGKDDIEWPHDIEILALWVAHRLLRRPDEDNARMALSAADKQEFDLLVGSPEVPAKVRQELLEYPDTLSFGVPNTTPSLSDYYFGV